MDIVSPATRSRMMAGIRSSNTKPELILRKSLHSLGFRYKLNTKILGHTPDVVLKKYNVAIFIHGCFWHRHTHCKYATTPKTNVHKWIVKFDENKKRDSRIEKALLESGWRVAVIWECWLKRKMELDWLFEWIINSKTPYVSWPHVNESENNSMANMDANIPIV